MPITSSVSVLTAFSYTISASPSIACITQLSRNVTRSTCSHPSHDVGRDVILTTDCVAVLQTTPRIHRVQ